MQSISPCYCSIIACNLGVFKEVEPHIICLLSSCLSSCGSPQSCFRCTTRASSPSIASSASSISSACLSHINYGGSLDSITSLAPSRLFSGLATRFSITVVLTPDSPEQKQESNMAEYLHIWGNMRKKDTCNPLLLTINLTLWMLKHNMRNPWSPNITVHNLSE